MCTEGLTNKMGVTVAELKRIIEGWPDKDETGEDSEVWVTTGPMSSSPCTTIIKMNATDILFVPQNYEDDF